MYETECTMKKKKQNDEAPLPAREAALRILERTGISAPVQSLLDTKLTAKKIPKQAFCFSCAESYFRI